MHVISKRILFERNIIIIIIIITITTIIKLNTSVTNSLMKLKTFNLRKHLAALRASTNSISRRNWIPKYYQINIFVIKLSYHYKLEFTKKIIVDTIFFTC